MKRELAYLLDKNGKNVQLVRKRNWTQDKLLVLFALNSVYQEILGPQELASYEGAGGVGGQIPVLHGTFKIDGSYRAKTRSAVSAFFNMVRELGFQEKWMTLATCGDVIYWIARYEREQETNGGGQRDE